MRGLLFTILVIIVIAVVIVMLRRRRSQSHSQNSSAQQAQRRTPRDPLAPEVGTGGDPLTIRAGDILEFGDDKCFVRGSLILSMGGSTWKEHFFQSDTTTSRRWLTVEEDPDLQMSVWHDRPDWELTPHAKTLTVEDTTYEMVEKGSGSYTSEGTTGLKSQGGFDYVDYESPQGHMLSFERFDHGPWEVSTGETVTPGSFTIYPGS